VVTDCIDLKLRHNNVESITALYERRALTLRDIISQINRHIMLRHW